MDSEQEVNGPGVPGSAGRYWQRNLRVIAWLTGLWATVTFVLMYFAPTLSFDFFGWPFSFWAAAQGALLVYVGIVCFYAWYMNRLDAQFDHDRSS